MNNKKDKGKKMLRISGLIGLFLLVFGLSYALFSVTLNGTKKLKVSTGKLSLRLLDESGNYIDDLNPEASTDFSIQLENAVPETYEDAIKREDNVYIFQLKNEGTIDAEYNISLEDLELDEGDERLNDSYIGYEILRGEEDVGLDGWHLSDLTNRTITKGLIKVGETYTFSLRIWIDDNTVTKKNQQEVMDKTFLAHLKVNGSQTKVKEEVKLEAAIFGEKTNSATYQEVQPIISDTEVRFPNVSATLSHPGDKATYTITLTNTGFFDLYLDRKDTIVSQQPFLNCMDKNVTENPECEKWNFENGDSVIKYTDLALLLNVFSGEKFSFPEKIKAGETITVTSFMEYNPSSEDKGEIFDFYGGDIVINYEKALS